MSDSPPIRNWGDDFYEPSMRIETSQRTWRMGYALRAFHSWSGRGRQRQLAGLIIAAFGDGGVHFARITAGLLARPRSGAGRSRSRQGALALSRSGRGVRISVDPRVQTLLVDSSGGDWRDAVINQRQTGHADGRTLDDGRDYGDRRADDDRARRLLRRERAMGNDGLLVVAAERALYGEQRLLHQAARLPPQPA